MKDHNKPQYAFITALGALTLTAVTSILVHFAKLKNEQIQTVRQIEEVEERIHKANTEMEDIKFERNRALDRFVLNQKLKELNSPLKPIATHHVELVPEANDEATATGVAVTLP